MVLVSSPTEGNWYLSVFIGAEIIVHLAQVRGLQSSNRHAPDWVEACMSRKARTVEDAGSLCNLLHRPCTNQSIVE